MFHCSFFRLLIVKVPDFFPDPIMAEPKIVEDTIPVDIDSEMQNDSNEDIIENIKVTYEEIPSDAAPDKTIPILVGVGVGLLTLLLIFLFTRRKSLGRGKDPVSCCRLQSINIHLHKHIYSTNTNQVIPPKTLKVSTSLRIV